MQDERGEDETLDEKDHLYELIRGMPTVIVRGQEPTGCYIPVDTGINGTKGNVVVKLHPEPEFIITLPMLNSKSKQGSTYVPKDNADQEKTSFGMEPMGTQKRTFLENEPMKSKDLYSDVVKNKNRTRTTPGNKKGKKWVYESKNKSSEVKNFSASEKFGAFLERNLAKKGE